MHAPALAALLLAFVQSPTQPENLLVDPGAEAGGKAPASWEKGNPVPGVEYLWEAKKAAEGKRSLGLSKKVERYFPIAQWVQAREHDGRARKLLFGGLVRAEEATKALLDVQFLDAQGEWSHAWAAYVGSRVQGDPPATHDWMWYGGVVEVPLGTKELRFGLQIYGPGKVSFDRLLAHWVDDATPASEPTQVLPRPPAEWGSLPPAEAARTARAQEPAAEASSAAERVLDGDPHKRYLLIEPRAKPPAAGAGLLVVLPGGDGSADFHPFVGRIAAQATPADYAVAQALAPRWSEAEDRVVWPTRGLPQQGMTFTSEELVRAIVADVRAMHRVDPARVFLLGWSSGGPACYAAALEKDSPVRGALVAMSVFKPEQLGSLAEARGRAFYLLHSPEDFIPLSFPERAERELRRAGARVELATYAGGHGWHGDVFGTIAKGLRWLEDNARGR